MFITKEHLCGGWWWWLLKGEVVSMGVYSDGSYGIEKGLIYSFPVTCKNGRYTIVQGLSVDDFSRAKMEDTQKELLEEKTEAFSFLH